MNVDLTIEEDPRTGEPTLVFTPAGLERFRNAAILREHDRRPLINGGLRSTCKTAHAVSGLPAGSVIPPGFTNDVVRIIDAFARKAEREGRLLEMNHGDLNATLDDLCTLQGGGGGKDARFLLAHGADTEHDVPDSWNVLVTAAHSANLPVMEALLDAGARELGQALYVAAVPGHNAVITLLLDRGADIHHNADAALLHAVINGPERRDTVQLLLNRGATVTADIMGRAEGEIADLLRAHLSS